MSVPGHALRCGPETSVTSPLRWRWFELRGQEKTYIQSSRPWECGNPEGISKECGKGGKPASWLPCFPYSVISMVCRNRHLRRLNVFKCSSCNHFLVDYSGFCWLAPIGISHRQRRQARTGAALKRPAPSCRPPRLCRTVPPSAGPIRRIQCGI
jgi:hypothetical protein